MALIGFEPACGCITIVFYRNIKPVFTFFVLSWKNHTRNNPICIYIKLTINYGYVLLYLKEWEKNDFICCKIFLNCICICILTSEKRLIFLTKFKSDYRFSLNGFGFAIINHDCDCMFTYPIFITNKQNVLHIFIDRQISSHFLSGQPTIAFQSHTKLLVEIKHPVHKNTKCLSASSRTMDDATTTTTPANDSAWTTTSTNTVAHAK